MKNVFRTERGNGATTINPSVFSLNTKKKKTDFKHINK